MLTLVLYLLLAPLLLILALIFRRFIPKQINKIYGYRTRRSMHNNETWREANIYAANLFSYIALTLNVFQAMCFMIFDEERAFLITAFAIMLGVVLIIPWTERHLRSEFPDLE